MNLGKTALSILFLIPFFIVGYLGATHFFPLNPRNEIKVLELGLQNKKWNLVHYLGGKCGCSKTIADYLIKRKPINSDSEQEVVVLLDEMAEKESQLISSGFKVFKYSAEKLKGSVDGVPLLVIFDQSSTVQYVGGYASTMINSTTELQDLKKLNEIKLNQASGVLPVLGCAVADDYKKLLDPLGLKYGSNE